MRCGATRCHKSTVLFITTLDSCEPQQSLFWKKRVLPPPGLELAGCIIIIITSPSFYCYLRNFLTARKLVNPLSQIFRNGYDQFAVAELIKSHKNLQKERSPKTELQRNFILHEKTAHSIISLRVFLTLGSVWIKHKLHHGFVCTKIYRLDKEPILERGNGTNFGWTTIFWQNNFCQCYRCEDFILLWIFLLTFGLLHMIYIYLEGTVSPALSPL